MTLQVVDSSGNGHQIPRTHREVEATITGADEFTDPLVVTGNQRVSVSVLGFGTATVTLQRRLDDENWRAVKTYAADTEETYLTDEQGDLRIGVDTGDYTSGTLIARLGLATL